MPRVCLSYGIYEDQIAYGMLFSTNSQELCEFRYPQLRNGVFFGIMVFFGVLNCVFPSLFIAISILYGTILISYKDKRQVTDR